jgi:glycine hydroxymethyltransferase
MGYPGDKVQTGLRHLEVIEVATTLAIARVIGAAYAEVRCPSATIANLAVYSALARPGDTIAVLSESAGGHASHHAAGAAGIRSLRIVEQPYDHSELDVDVTALDAFLEDQRPSLVVVGASLSSSHTD